MAYIVLAYSLQHGTSSYMVMAYIIIPYIVMTYTVMALIIMAYILMAYIGMAFSLPPRTVVTQSFLVLFVNQVYDGRNVQAPLLAELTGRHNGLADGSHEFDVDQWVLTAHSGAVAMALLSDGTVQVA